MKMTIIGAVCGLAVWGSQAWAASATCKANMERFNAALMPYTNIQGMALSESVRHSGWAAQEMVYAVRNGCEPGRNADERAQLQEFENAVQDAIRVCQQMTSGGDCSPKKGAAAASYRRPDLARPGSEAGQAAPGSGVSTPDSGRGSGGASASPGGMDGGGRGGSSAESPLPETPAQQAVERAQQWQAKAEEQRKKDKRRKNYPELDASTCLTPIEGRPGVSGFKNSCPYPVRYTYCVENPDPGTGAAFVDCSKQSGAGTVPARGEDFAHMKGGDRVHHLACKPPGTAITRQFSEGRIQGDCAKLGS